MTASAPYGNNILYKLCVTDTDTMMENNEGNAGSLFGGLGGLGAPRQSNLQVMLL